MAQNSVNAQTLKVIARERRYLVAAALGVLVALGLSYFILLPQVRFMLGAQKTLETRSRELARVQSKVDFLTSFDTAQFKTQNARVNEILPSYKPFMQLLFGLEALAIQEGAAFAGLDISPGEIGTESAVVAQNTKDGLNELGFDLRIIGTSAALRSVIDKIDFVAPALDVKNFTLTPKTRGADEAQNQYEAKIRLNALYAPLKLTGGGTTIPPKLTEQEEAFVSELEKYVLPSQTIESEFGGVQPAPAVEKQNPFAQ